MKLANNRKAKLSELALSYSKEFKTESELPDLNSIALSEDIKIIYDHYKTSFEGMTICQEGEFYIHIDLDSVKDVESGRARFTLAHELAHSLIDEHRLGLLTGVFEPHVSDYLLGNDDKLIELEADYFASSLLMPEDYFRKKAKEFSGTFSVEMIYFLADYFKTSIMATLLRFVEIGTESIFITYCKNKKIKWYSKSIDFPDWPMKFRVGGEVPENTIVGNYYRNNKEKTTEIETVEKEAWFYPKSDLEFNLKEQCIYVEEYDYIISILWFSG